MSKTANPLPRGQRGKSEKSSLRDREHRAERKALLIAYAFQSPWADKHLPPDPNSKAPPEAQLKHQYMLAAQHIVPHLTFEVGFDDSPIHVFWDEAKILRDAGPLPITKAEADFMRGAVLDMETSAKLWRASYPARAAKAAAVRARRER